MEVPSSAVPSISSSLTSQKLRTALKAHDILVKLVEPASTLHYEKLLDELAVVFEQLEQIIGSREDGQA